MAEYDAAKKIYVRTTRNIGSHLNLKTITCMITDIMEQGAKNVIEVEILNNLNSNNLTSVKAARVLKDEKVLSQGGFANRPLTNSTLAVCHKISFCSFDTAMVALMNYERDPAKSIAQKNMAWNYFEELLGVLYPAHGYSASIATHVSTFRGVVATNTDLACSQAHDILLQFDASGDNLYFGFQETNASVSSRVDLHYDINTAITSAGLAQSTPRGPILMDSLNRLEAHLGLQQSGQRVEMEYVGSLSVKWVMTSGLDNKGWIEGK